MLAPLAELVIEIITIVIGSLYLVLSGSIEDLILNAVAVNFVTQLDELMLSAFVNKASLQRMAKYLVEVPFGVEEGDTQLKHVSSNTLRMQRALEYLPIVLLLLSCGGVAGGQVWGHYRAGQLGIEPECTIVLAQIA